MSKLKAYFLNKKYHNFLKSNIQEFLFKDRPYIGFIGINIQNQKYAIPLWSDKSNTYKTSHRYSFFIPDKNNKKLGILRIDKMIPILEDKAFVNEISINELPFEDSIRLIQELEYINQPQNVEQINLLANEIRFSRNSNDSKFAIDFEYAESLCLEYAQKNNLMSKNSNTSSLNFNKDSIRDRYASYFENLFDEEKQDEIKDWINSKSSKSEIKVGI